MYPIRTGSKVAPQDVALNDRARELTGEEGKASEKAAVKRSDVSALGNIKLQSNLIAGTPSAADHNALVNDLRTIAAILNAMGANINV